MNLRISFLTAIALVSAAGTATRAEFVPVSLTSESFTQDVVVEPGALHAPSLVATTASMDNGTNNTAWGWYEQGYNLEATFSGLPLAGTTISSLTFPDHSYTFAADYRTNNALMVDTNLTTATLQVTSPTAVTGLSFLTAAGHGPITVGITIHHADGGVETNSFVSPDWFTMTDSALTSDGRVDVQTAAFDGVGTGNPNLLTADVVVSNPSPVTAIDFNGTNAGGGHAFVFAVSGETEAGAGFVPLEISGFNVDAIIESTANHPLTSLEATTASLDAGVANTGYTYYSVGYNTNSAPTNAALSGIPAAGSILTNVSAPDHRYVMPPSYAGNNASLVDAENPGTLTLETPTAFSALSFLTAAGNGAVTIEYTVTHADASTETGTFVSPDWFNAANPAYIANGRVGVQNGALDNVNNNNPRLYAADVSLQNTTSPVTSVDLLSIEGTGHAVVFALSGATGSGAPTIVTHPTNTTVLAGSNAQFASTVTGTLPLTYLWQVQTNGEFVNLANAGNVSGANTATLSINNVNFGNEGQYRLVVTNASGSATSFVGTLFVLSSGTTVTTPGDVIEAVGTNSPVNEPVANVIDQTTAKYLNFGDTNNAAPFIGPIGFVVTPSIGSDVAGTIVTALRIYTANDHPERDPGDYTIEGSNDGINFTLIASGSLALPNGRNAGALPLDPLTQPVQEARFANSIPYKSYRVIFPNARDNATANSIQVAEVELIGTVAATGVTQLSITREAAGTLTITSSQPGTLQSTTALATDAVWADEGPINGSVTVNATGDAKFYRVLVQP
jgi:hypothetical protein